MKCPLLCIGNYSVELMQDNPAFDCLKEECAWWNKEQNACSIFGMVEELRAIQWELQGIREKMPHAGQFAK